MSINGAELHRQYDASSRYSTFVYDTHLTTFNQGRLSATSDNRVWTYCWEYLRTLLNMWMQPRNHQTTIHQPNQEDAFFQTAVDRRISSRQNDNTTIQALTFLASISSTFITSSFKRTSSVNVRTTLLESWLRPYYHTQSSHSNYPFIEHARTVLRHRLGLPILQLTFSMEGIQPCHDDCHLLTAVFAGHSIILSFDIQRLQDTLVRDVEYTTPVFLIADHVGTTDLYLFGYPVYNTYFLGRPNTCC